METFIECCLLRLSAEIRNIIYDFIFAFDITRPAELIEALPPYKGFVLACRQKHKKAKPLYVEAYRTYWKDTWEARLGCGLDGTRKKRA